MRKIKSFNKKGIHAGLNDHIRKVLDSLLLGYKKFAQKYFRELEVVFLYCYFSLKTQYRIPFSLIFPGH